MPEVLFDQKPNGVGVLTLSEPDALNAMDESMAAAFQKTVKPLSGLGLRALVITGAGRAFSAGGNLQMLEAKSKLSKAENKKKMLEFYESFLCMRDLGVPLIAAVNGHAIGAGLCLSLACDIRVVSKDAKLGMTFTKLGLHPGMGGTFFLPQVVGNAVALELLLTGRVIQGEDVRSCGIARSVVSTEEVLPKALQIADEIIACGPEATRQLLETLRPSPNELQSALDREAECQSENYGSPEFLEGVRAVQEKRSPNF